LLNEVAAARLPNESDTNMSVQVRCLNPACGRTVGVAEEYLGRRACCPHCGTTFTCARPANEPSEAPPTVLPLDEDTSATPAPFGPTLRTSAPSGPGLPAQVGRFQVRAWLGAGAFGAVYRAYDPQLEREVALKVPHPGSLDSPTAAERFLREAKAAARLHHAHIVPVHEAGFDGTHHYIATAFIEGCTLARAIEERRLDFRQAAKVVRDLAEALDYAHKSGVVHRDVKPANVMLDQRGDAYLTDFGLAHRQDAGMRLTQSGSVMGTPAYMAPEQAAGQSGPPLPASDQYSVGVILYELLCGCVPFSGPPAVVLFNVQHCDPPPPRAVTPGVPPRLEAICLKAMARKVESRYGSMGEFAAALAEYLRRESQPARIPEPSPSPLPVPKPSSTEQVQPPEPAPPVQIMSLACNKCGSRDTFVCDARDFLACTAGALATNVLVESIGLLKALFEYLGSRE
jgi:serine/threonine protein kinase